MTSRAPHVGEWRGEEGGEGGGGGGMLSTLVSGRETDISGRHHSCTRRRAGHSFFAPFPTPCRRCAFGTLNQLIFLPAFFIIARISQGSIGEWEQTRLLEQLWQARKVTPAACPRHTAERIAAWVLPSGPRRKEPRLTAVLGSSNTATCRRPSVQAAHAAAERFERMATEMATESRAAGGRMAAAASAGGERIAARGQAVVAEGHAAAERMAGAGAAACGRSVDFAERLAASGFGAAERMALKAAEQVRTTFAEAAPAPRQPAP